jgi:hypothetical protein
LPTSKTRLEALRRRTHGNSQIWSAMQTRVRRTGIPAATSAACALYGQVADRRCEADLSALICHLIRPNSLARKPTRSPRVRRGQPSTKAGRIFRIVASRFQWRCRLSGPNVKGAFSEWPTIRPEAVDAAASRRIRRGRQISAAGASRQFDVERTFPHSLIGVRRRRRGNRE